jgi:hypothetical protein
MYLIQKGGGGFPALPALQPVSGNRSRYTVTLPKKNRQGKTKRNR